MHTDETLTEKAQKTRDKHWCFWMQIFLYVWRKKEPFHATWKGLFVGLYVYMSCWNDVSDLSDKTGQGDSWQFSITKWLEIRGSLLGLR